MVTPRFFNSKQSFKQLASRALNNVIQPRRRIYLGEHFSRGSLSEIELETPVPLAGRQYLASSYAPNFPKHLSGPKEDFPLLVKANNKQGVSMKQWAARSREIIDQAFQKYKDDQLAVAVLFRGLPNSNEQDFSEWVNNLGFRPFPYIGGTSARNDIAQNVSEGAQDQAPISFEPHNDMAYSSTYPKMLSISCLKKPAWGGETAICDNRVILSKLDPAFVQKCVKKNIRYWCCLHDKDSSKSIYQSWQMSFKTDDRSEVDKYLKGNGYEFAWDRNNSLFYWKTQPPYRYHAMSGERIWFNQIGMHHSSYWKQTPYFENMKLPDNEYPNNATYGDGEDFEHNEMDEHRRCIWESAVGFKWQNGDILFVDQLLVRHSRLGFLGNRKVGIAIFDY